MGKSLLMLFHTTRSMSFAQVDAEQTKLSADVQLCSQRLGLNAVPALNLESLPLGFHDVVGNPIATVKKLAAFAGLDWNATIEAKAEAAVQAAAQRKKEMGGKIVYQMDAFGLTEEDIAERLQNCGRYGIHEPSFAAEIAAKKLLTKPMCKREFDGTGVLHNLTDSARHNQTYCHGKCANNASSLVVL